MKFYFCSKHGTAAKIALVDSGATKNFLNHDTAKQLGIIPKELPTPQIMNNVNRSLNQSGLVKHYYDFRLKMGDREPFNNSMLEESEQTTSFWASLGYKNSIH